MSFDWQKKDPNYVQPTAQAPSHQGADTGFGSVGGFAPGAPQAFAPVGTAATQTAGAQPVAFASVEQLNVSPFPSSQTPSEQVPSFAQPQPAPATAAPAVEAAPETPTVNAPSFQDLMRQRETQPQPPVAATTPEPAPVAVVSQEPQDVAATLQNLLDSEVFHATASPKDRLEAIALRDMLQPGREAQLQMEGFHVALGLANSFKGPEAEAFHDAVRMMVETGQMSTVAPSTRQYQVMQSLQDEVAGLRESLQAVSALNVGQQIGGAAGTLAATALLGEQVAADEQARIAADPVGPAQPLNAAEQATLDATEQQLATMPPQVEQRQGSGFAERYATRQAVGTAQQTGF